MILRFYIFGLLLNICITSAALAINLQLPVLNEFQLPVPATLSHKMLGTALSISGSTAAVAAGPESNLLSGSVYIYNAKEDWRLTAELNSGNTSDNFANQIKLVNDILIVSADRDDAQGIDSGAIYVFERDKSVTPHQWQQTSKITAPDAQSGDQFGYAIALVENILYIGSPLHGQGKVYAFSQDTQSKNWVLVDSVEPDDPQALRFGAAIAQDNNILIIGAPDTDADGVPTLKTRLEANPLIQPRFAISKGDTIDPGIESGAIYVYENQSGSWLKTTRIGASNRESGDHLGEQLAIEGDIIIATLNQKDVWDDLRAGAVYIYKKVKNVWREDTALTANPAQLGGAFGTSLSVLDNHILVGANKTHSNGFNSGQVFLFAQDANQKWPLIHMQTNAAVKAHDQFGISVALGDEHLLVASKHAVFAFQNTPMQQQAAIFYTDTNTLHLNEVAVAGLGVFSAMLQLNQQNETLLLSVTASHLRTDIESSSVNYSSSGQLTIPRLAVQQNNGDRVFYSATLEQVSGAETLQFKVIFLNQTQ